METNEELNNTLKKISSAKTDPDEGLSKESLELLLRNEDLNDKRQDRELRKSYAQKIFISVCVLIFGPTKAGETYLTDRDFLFIQRGCFSRLWDKIYIDMMTNENGVKTMNITIFSPKQYNYE